VACFDASYRSEQPVHPARTFRGSEQVRKNWSAFFREIPNLRAELLASAAGEDTEWGEWHWHGTRAGGSAFEMRGVTVMGVRDNHIVWGRLYMEEVEEAGQDIDQAVQCLAGTRERAVTKTPAIGRPSFPPSTRRSRCIGLARTALLPLASLHISHPDVSCAKNSPDRAASTPMWCPIRATDQPCS
jgi:ketosteroid isomerase-like protein